MVMGGFLNHWLRFQADSLGLTHQAYGVSEAFPKAQMLPHIRLDGIDTRNKLMLYEGDEPKFVTADIHVTCRSDLDESFSQQMRISMSYDSEPDRYLPNLNHHLSISIYLSQSNFDNVLKTMQIAKLKSISIETDFIDENRNDNPYEQDNCWRMREDIFNAKKFEITSDTPFDEGFIFSFSHEMAQ